MRDCTSEDFLDSTLPYRRDYTASLITKLLNKNGIDAVFWQRILFYSSDAKVIVEKLSESVKKDQRTHLLALSIKGSTPKHLHSVALMVEPLTKRIIFQDPKGVKMPHDLRKNLKKYFLNYEINNARIPQQKDEVSCAVITTDNLLRFANGQEFDKNPDTAMLRRRHEEICKQTYFIPQRGNKSGKKFVVTS